MKVQVKYRSGRLDVFDTDSYTPAQPFGDACMQANYEVRFDDLERGLWLQAHFYEADPSFKEGLDDGVVPVGRRSMGWRFLLAEPGELDGVEQVLVDGERTLVRMGNGLVDVMRLDCASSLMLSDGGGPSLVSKLQGVVDALMGFDFGIDDEAASALVGANWESYVWAKEVQPSRQAEIDDEEEGWMDNEGD